jgi:HTH-type transcriptional regulator/antitoxin HigA
MAEYVYNPKTISHPGRILKEKLDELNLTQKEFAQRSDKPEKTISQIINGESSITSDMAVIFENVTKIPYHFWMNYQGKYDELKAREREEEKLSQSIEWLKNFPIREMQKMGWVHKQTTQIEKLKELLKFFGVANQDAWEKYYIRGKLQVAYRISKKINKDKFAVSAWLRKGEIDAEQLFVTSYNESKLKKALPVLKELMANPNGNFLIILRTILLETGVKLILTPCLPKAPLNGSTRWIGSNPVVQLSGRGKRYDILWFTLFHEIGHVLLHGKKDVFIEDGLENHEAPKEIEADEFAEKWTFSKEDEKRIISNWPMKEAEIINEARELNTHPSIIIGRLIRRKILLDSEIWKYNFDLNIN